jgi:hypothetical protein
MQSSKPQRESPSPSLGSSHCAAPIRAWATSRSTLQTRVAPAGTMMDSEENSEKDDVDLSPSFNS